MLYHAFAERRIYADRAFPVSSWVGHNLHFVAHWHNEVEIIFVERGQLKMGINQLSLVLCPGDLAILGSNDIHYYDGGDADCQYHLVIFAPELVGLTTGWPRGGQAGTSIIRGVDGKIPPEWAKLPVLMDRIIQEMGQKTKAWQPMVRAALWEIYAWTGRLGQVGEDLTACDGDALTLDRMQRAIDYIHRNFRKPISLAEISAAAVMSPCYFSRLFSRFTGQNLSACVNRVRVEMAKELLAGNDSVMDIALACGFASLRSFNRAFKAHTGLTPREIRRQTD